MSQRVFSNVGCAQVPLSTEISPAASTVPDTQKRNLGLTLVVLGGPSTLRREPGVSWTPATEAQDQSRVRTPRLWSHVRAVGVLGCRCRRGSVVGRRVAGRPAQRRVAGMRFVLELTLGDRSFELLAFLALAARGDDDQQTRQH
jgi:hypothetical protein